MPDCEEPPISFFFSKVFYAWRLAAKADQLLVVVLASVVSNLRGYADTCRMMPPFHSIELARPRSYVLFEAS